MVGGDRHEDSEIKVVLLLADAGATEKKTLKIAAAASRVKEPDEAPSWDTSTEQLTHTCY